MYQFLFVSKDEIIDRMMGGTRRRGDIGKEIDYDFKP